MLVGGTMTFVVVVVKINAMSTKEKQLRKCTVAGAYTHTHNLQYVHWRYLPPASGNTTEPSIHNYNTCVCRHPQNTVLIAPLAFFCLSTLPPYYLASELHPVMSRAAVERYIDLEAQVAEEEEDEEEEFDGDPMSMSFQY
jgi:hypothetical protein